MLLKVVRAKLPGTLEGGGVGVKHKQTNNFFDKGAHFYHNRPWGIGLTSISNVKRVMCTQFQIMGELHLTSVSIFHDMICPLKFTSNDIVCVVLEMLEEEEDRSNMCVK